MRRFVVLSLASLAVAVAAPLAAAQPRGPAVPVPSHQPRLTHALWERLVHRRHAFATRAAAGCRPVRLIFYTADDWLRLATKLAANASPCAQYDISIPPLAADKTNFRPAQPALIRALGPQFHALAEISYNGWSNWVAQTGATFYDAGVEARRRMAAQGFDVSAGDSWVVNELSSALRANAGTARQKIRDLVRGLYDGGGTMPKVKGGVYVIGVGQSSSDVAGYKLNLQSWFGDSGFWQDMQAYVGDWAQEVYGDVRDFAVAGADPATRAAYLNDYLQHPLALAAAAPPEDAAAASYLAGAYSPLANAAWAYDSAFGFTDVPLASMEDYVSAQVQAMRTYDAARGSTDRFGFAWSPRMPDGSSWTPAFTDATSQLLDRLAAAIHDSDASPAAACAGWCTSTLDGAAFTAAWQTFAAWSYPTLAFTSSPEPVAAGSPAQVSVQLQQAGIVQTASSPLAVTLSASTPSGAFAPTAGGPWTPTLTVPVAAGASTATAFFRDTAPGAPVVTASAAGWQPATQTETIAAAPAPAPGGAGGGVAPDLTVGIVPSLQTLPAAGGELDLALTVSTLNAGGSSDAQLDVDLPAGFALVRASTDRGTCSASALHLTCDVAWINPTTSTHVTLVGTVAQAVPLRFAATVASKVETELDPSDNSTSVTVAPAVVPVEASPGKVVALRALRPPLVVGRAAAGRTLHARAGSWSRAPSRVSYRWQLCRRSHCRTVAGTTLHLRRTDVGATVRLVARASAGGATATASSARLLVRRR